MTRNDTFFKILFAIEIALLPLVIAASILSGASQNGWVVCLLVAGVLVAKIWMEIFKNKNDRIHIIINAAGNVLSLSILIIFFTTKGYINVALCVFVVIFIVLMNTLKVLLFGASMPDMIDAVDTCNMLFECLTLIGLVFVMYSTLLTDIALFALLLTAIVSFAYKVYYIIRRYNVIGAIKDFFSKLFRRR